MGTLPRAKLKCSYLQALFQTLLNVLSILLSDPLANKIQKSGANTPLNWQYIYKDTFQAVAIFIFIFNQICLCETSN